MIRLALHLAFIIIASTPRSSRVFAQISQQGPIFKPVTSCNGTNMCTMDPPSAVMTHISEDSQVNSVAMPGKVMCAWQCTQVTSCVGYNYRMYSRTCEFYYYQPTSFAIHEDCATFLTSSMLSSGLHSALVLENDGTGALSRPWVDFKNGYGDTDGNYWYGNDRLHQMTTSTYTGCTLSINLQASADSKWYLAQYCPALVDSEANGYRLTVSGYSGNATDALSSDNGADFTTSDEDNDQLSSGNCAVTNGGGFWYSSCGGAMISAESGTGQGFIWKNLPSGSQLKYARVFIQCL